MLHGLGRDKPRHLKSRALRPGGKHVHEPGVVHVHDHIAARRKDAECCTGTLLALGESFEPRQIGRAADTPRDRTLDEGRAGVAVIANDISGCQSFAELGYNSAQFRVYDGTVKTLVEVVPECLPVALEIQRHRMHGDGLSQIPVRQESSRVGECPVIERRRGFVQIDEDETRPFSDSNIIERVPGGIESATLKTPGCCCQFAFERVGPCVIGAHDPLAAKISVRFLAEYRTAVPAGVVESLQPTAPVTCDDDALVTNFHNLIGHRPPPTRQTGLPATIVCTRFA